MTPILIMVSVPFVAGFALGWGLRSLLSYHRREKARRYGRVPDLGYSSAPSKPSQDSASGKSA